jgi:hypothetical protein
LDNPSIPDTAHRHLAYYRMWMWHRSAETIPAVVEVDDQPVEKDEILDLLEAFDPDAEAVFVDVYNLTSEHEGYLFDQFNTTPKTKAQRRNPEGRPETDDQGRPVTEEVAVMARNNPDWVGRVIVVTAKDGVVTTTLSNTRQTRETAFQYLCEKGGVKFDARPVSRRAKARS